MSYQWYRISRHNIDIVETISYQLATTPQEALWLSSGERPTTVDTDSASTMWRDKNGCVWYSYLVASLSSAEEYERWINA